MRPGPMNLITDVPGIRVGNAKDRKIKTGCTVVLSDAPMTAGYHVMGGAPGTRETDLLAPDKSVEAVDALVLSGGSGFGLDAGSGVADALAADGRGFPVGPVRVPIVPGAILFDLINGGDKAWVDNPYKRLGREAYAAARDWFELGSDGAGTGATTASLKGGLGSASIVLPGGIVVGAVVAVNALGSATVGDGPQFWAAPWEQGDEFGGLGVATAYPDGRPATKGHGQNTTIAVVATNAALSKAQCTRLAIAAHDGIARALVPSHSPMDGDLIFAASTGALPCEDLLWLGHAAATCVARASARGVYLAAPAPGDSLPTWSQRFGR
ncbi:P1 family peptidase [Flavimaricola marinus]|uniref:Peptidase family S58 n=1 Tax=Flavimaricola marinus TaxID=1819565 RepID=A0A238L923_9RHOB|nr:P1 family peptidase [Flavimaricola marinus]SMY06168.1 Peptidase family S58 [Flavimaricola marinus]